MTKIINLISGPRNISTALMYSFAQRSDTEVVDEPFYAYYLSQTGKEHPGRDEVLSTMESDALKVINMLQNHTEKPVLFVKNMAHHLCMENLDFLHGYTNVFLIRDPKQLIASFAQVIKQPDMQDIGVEAEYRIYEQLIAKGEQVVVVDSNEVLKDPEFVLTQLCEKLGISFVRDMLSWTAGPIKEDGIWAKYWYRTLHKTAGFAKQISSSRVLPEHLFPLHRKAKPYYDKLFEKAIKAPHVTEI